MTPDKLSFVYMELKEKKLESKLIYKGKILDFYVDKVKCSNGNVASREVIRHCKASCILAKLPNGKFLLEQQYRYPYDEILYEFPAGKCDENEKPLDAAKRELEEETGYRANHIEYLGKMYPSCAYTDEIIYLYYADNLIKTKQHLDENETVKVCEMSLDEIIELVNNDKLYDAKSVCLLNYYLLKILKKY